MLPSRPCSFVVGLALLAAACGEGSPQAQNAQQKVELRNEISAILEKITDRPSAQQAIATIKNDLVPRWKRVADEGKSLGEGPLDSQLEMRIRSSSERLAKAKLKLSGFPGEVDELNKLLTSGEVQ